MAIEQVSKIQWSNPDYLSMVELFGGNVLLPVSTPPGNLVTNDSVFSAINSYTISTTDNNLKTIQDIWNTVSAKWTEAPLLSADWKDEYFNKDTFYNSLMQDISKSGQKILEAIKTQGGDVGNNDSVKGILSSMFFPEDPAITKYISLNTDFSSADPVLYEDLSKFTNSLKARYYTLTSTSYDKDIHEAIKKVITDYYATDAALQYAKIKVTNSGVTLASSTSFLNSSFNTYNDSGKVTGTYKVKDIIVLIKYLIDVWAPMLQELVKLRYRGLGMKLGAESSIYSFNEQIKGIPNITLDNTYTLNADGISSSINKILEVMQQMLEFDPSVEGDDYYSLDIKKLIPGIEKCYTSYFYTDCNNASKSSTMKYLYNGTGQANRRKYFVPITTEGEPSISNAITANIAINAIFGFLWTSVIPNRNITITGNVGALMRTVTPEMYGDILQAFTCHLLSQWELLPLARYNRDMFIIDNCFLCAQSQQALPQEAEPVKTKIEYVSFNEVDIRQKMRSKNTNTFTLKDYNWTLPIDELQDRNIDLLSLPHLDIYEFQPDRSISLANEIDSFGSATGKNLKNMLGSFFSNTSTALSSGLKDIVAPLASAAVKVAGNEALNKLSNVQDTVKYSNNISWTNSLLSGVYVGQYQVPYANKEFISGDGGGWSIGDLIQDADSGGGIRKTLKESQLTLSALDVPLWKFSNKQSKKTCTTKMILQNNTMENTKKNLAFLFAITSGAFYLKDSSFSYRAPNLYRIICPGRFAYLYSTISITTSFVGKSRLYSPEEAQLIFGTDDEYEVFNTYKTVEGTCYIPEAYSIDITFTDITPDAMNIHTALFTAGLGSVSAADEASNADINKSAIVPNVTIRQDGGSNTVTKVFAEYIGKEQAAETSEGT